MCTDFQQVHNHKKGYALNPIISKINEKQKYILNKGLHNTLQ